MRKTKFRTRLRLLILLLLLLAALMSYAVGKYMSTVTITGNVKFTAKLAETFELREHVISKKADGTYETTAATITNETQSYVLIPGVDVPKDPHIVIEGKTEIPAYLYIEIVDGLDTVTVNGTSVKLIDYELTSDWGVTTTKANQHGGTVYVYTGGGNTPLQLTGAAQNMTIYILANNEVTVSQHIKHADTDGTDLITFYAYLEEVVLTNP